MTELKVALREYQLPGKVGPHAAASSPPHCLVLVHLYTSTPLHLYTSTPLHLYTSTPLHFHWYLEGAQVRLKRRLV